ncbi:type II toxin-antitoxin system antitoxin DNA ADP-ribosyl glycohydrolase DarG [Veillonella sp.]
MITFVNTDIFTSPAQALVNTVNCEGYMGKGLAYQFKLMYPEMNKDYVNACKRGDVVIGRMHTYQTNDKLIINFPTKNQWRKPSKMEYIKQGIEDLIRIINEQKIKSIAIPPLGSGNGGLDWSEVRDLLSTSLESIQDVDVYIHEPGKFAPNKAKHKPKLTLAALLLLDIKRGLRDSFFNQITLQKTAFFMDVKLAKPYFHFKKYKFGPYDHSIDIVSRNIKEYLEYHSIQDVDIAYQSVKNEIISKKVNDAYESMQKPLQKAIAFVNSLTSIKQVECVATVLFIVQQADGIAEQEIINQFTEWSQRKAEEFTITDIKDSIELLLDAGYIEETLIGYARIVA